MDLKNKIFNDFKDAGIEIHQDEAIERARQFDKLTDYRNMSEDSENSLRKTAVNMGLIPPQYINAEFDMNKIKEHVRNIVAKAKNMITIERYENYFNVCNSIINTLRIGKLPVRSYIIGAPNGFGKQSFATDCILASLHNGWITVPYISLLELAEIKSANDKIVARGLMGMETKIAKNSFNYQTGLYENDDNIESFYYAMGDKYNEFKVPAIITGRYSWSEYINAPFLVCFFSGIESKLIESQILNTLLNIRSAKGYPTVAMISTSIEMYKKDPVIGKYIWSEILNPDPESNDLSRVLHISMYKRYRNETM